LVQIAQNLREGLKIFRVDREEVFRQALGSPRADTRQVFEVLQQNSDGGRSQVHL
jgi:hypothetical protein